MSTWSRFRRSTHLAWLVPAGALWVSACQPAPVPVAAAASPTPGPVGSDSSELIPAMAGTPTPAPATFKLAALPPDNTFPHADDDVAARWGQRAFYDTRLSSTGTFSCATCHQPDKSFTDGRPRATAIADGTRNTPSLLLAAYHKWQGWGGRADSLWAQSLAALENPKELGMDHVGIARYVLDHERTTYEQLYGPAPDASSWPAHGSPGQDAYDRLPDATRRDIETVAARQGQALASYVRKLIPAPSAFDRYLAGDTGALTAQQQQGFDVFRGKASCVQCHKGPLLSDDDFHDLGTPLPIAPPYDEGRLEDLPKLLADPFSGAGAYGLVKRTLPASVPDDLGKFRTPGLRNVAVTAPYMHLGNFVSLAAVVDFDLAGGGNGSHHFFQGKVDPLLKPVNLTADERAALLAFLDSLTTGSVPAPWSGPPTP